MLSKDREQHDCDTEGDGPLRLCVATRRTKPPGDLIRFVAAPDGQIMADLAHKLPGRGVWVGATYSDVAGAVRTKAFARSLKHNVTVAQDLADQVETLLVRRLSESISLANKAGQLLTGFTKIDAAVAGGGVVALLHGSDAAEDGRQKLDRKLAAVAESRGATAVVLVPLTIHELSLAIGRENVVHAALTEGGAARRVLAEAERLALYRSGKPVS